MEADLTNMVTTVCSKTEVINMYKLGKLYNGAVCISPRDCDSYIAKGKRLTDVT